MTKIISNNQLGKQINYNAVDNKIEVNLDGLTLKANETTGVISVDPTELGFTVVSTDAGNIITSGSDDGAFLQVDVIKDIVGEMVSALDDGIDFDALTKTLTAVLQTFAVTDSNSVDLTVVDNDGDLNLSAEVIYSSDAGNRATSGSDGGVFVPEIPATTVDAVVDTVEPKLTLTVDGVDKILALEELQDLAGVKLGYVIS